MAITGGGNTFIFEDDGFNIRGAWTTTDTYSSGDIVYYGNPAISYLAQADIAANVIPTTANSGWARLAARGTDGSEGPEGRYTILVFARSATEPRAPNNTDATYPADAPNFSSTVWTRAAIPSGTETLWMSFIRVRPSSQALNFGEVTRLTGEDGTDGVNADIEFSDNSNGPWSDTSDSNTEYIRLRVGTGPWSNAIRIKGEDGAPGESAQMQFSPDGSSDWVTVARSTDEWIRFRIGNSGMWTVPLRYRGEDGIDGASVAIEFSADNVTWHSGNPISGDKYIRFIIGSSPASVGIRFVGRDGNDGDDSLQVQYNSSNTPSTFHNDLRANDDWIRFRVGTSAWSIGRQFVGSPGAAAPNVLIEFSQDGNRWENTPRTGDVFIRFSNDNGATWTNAVRFLGASGAGGESISIEYSIDGQAAWHANLSNADYFIRIQVGTRGWSDGVRFRAYPLMTQYSIDGSTLWHATFSQGNDKFIRFSTDNGVTWTTGDRFVGEDGTDGDDSLEVQYSADNTAWSNTLATTTRYIRFRTGGSGPWSTGLRFVGWTGGFLDTLFRRSQTMPLGPLNLEYNWDTNSYRNLGNGWTEDVPSGTDTLWKIQYWVPPQDETTEIVRPTVRGSIYTDDGADGSDGNQGDSIRVIYQRKTGAAPATPSGGSWDGTTYTEPSGWSLTPPVGTARLYGSIVALSGTDQTNSGITYTTVLELEALDGADGGSIDFIYRRSSTALTTPPSNTGITATGGVLNNVPTDWSLTIPGGTDPLYASIATITANISFSEPIRLTGVDGSPGSDGDSIRTIYQRSASEPMQPANGTGSWNGSDYDPPSGWHESIPTGTEDLYTCIVHLSGSDKTNSGITYDQRLRFSPRDGRDGVPGVETTVQAARFEFVPTPGPDGETTDVKVRSTRARTSDPWTRGYADITAFTGGTAGLATQDASGITIVEQGVYSFSVQIDIDIRGDRETLPRSIWGLILHIEDSGGTRIDDFTFFDQIYDSSFAYRELIPAYGSTPPLNLPAGAKAYIRIFYQRLDRSGTTTDPLNFRVQTPVEDDDRIVVRKYTASGGGGGGSTTAGSSIDVIYRRSSSVLTVAPTGGTGLNGEVRTPPPDWSTTVPSGTDTLYTSIAHIDGSNNVSYDEPIRWQGERGLSEVAVWARSANRPGVPVTLRFNQDTTLSSNSAGGLTWYRDPAAATGTAQLWVAYVLLDTNTSEPERTWLGSPIEDGAGRAGTNGRDGNSTLVVYQRKAGAAPSTPSGGTWNGSDYDPPSGWFEAEPSGTDALYGSTVTLSGSDKTNNGISYSAPYRLTGSAGTNGLPGQSYVIIYMASASTPANPGVGSLVTAGDPSTYTPASGWSVNVPARTTTADIYQAYVTIPRTGTAPTITRALFLEERSSSPVVPPSTGSAGITYGIADNTPQRAAIGVASVTPTQDFTVGQSHTFTVDVGPTTANNQNFYMQAPTGYTITSIVDSLVGETISEWTNVMQRWFFFARRRGSDVRYTVTMRRNS